MSFTDWGKVVITAYNVQSSKRGHAVKIAKIKGPCQCTLLNDFGCLKWSDDKNG